MLAELLVITLLATAGPVTIDGVYPNPTTDGDRGEFVILSVPENTTPQNLELTDGEDTIDLSGIEANGRVVVTADPGPASNLTDLPIHETDSFLSLSNGGEWVTLRGETSASNLTYPRAPEGELYRNGRFEPIARSNFRPMTTRNVSVTTTVLPDDPTPLTRAIDSAGDRILLAGYTFTDPSVTDALISAHRRNVTVRALIEGGPVGGISGPQMTQLDRLHAAGVPIAVMGTDRARYRYQHAKYAVVDDRAVVTSENWKPGGTGGNGSRGWAAVMHDPKVAADLARIFRADTAFVDTRSWAESRPTEPVEGGMDTTRYPTRFPAQSSQAEQVTVLTAPDNAAGAVRGMLANATESIRIQQVSIDPSTPLLNESIAAARRGVSVRILLSGAWYAESENRALARSLRDRAEREDLPLTVRLAEPRSRYEHVHAKSVIVDGESVLLGSLNWNPNALRENREVAVRIDDPKAGTYFERVFRADWRGAAWRLPWGVLFGASVILFLGLAAARSFADFEN
ncbi:phospholipase D-like domain-containing protein [Halodesulfurarchaeum sp. HSR-GB]|uniref:phospholipase D-like domain-containing protein n=1 Tax=Halodesulfurarchaeum sp. HSR-GB TaxID=3074077 RepID=UPI002859E758|nr:phospholipase D-like domain-containing protein [Halodesulfurarchaeum sp. HSR-GB]MDR5656991.1 phospholipase D-like domain-containing protein [Halodesulfurarchaeum sp. HSR-GB]